MRMGKKGILVIFAAVIVLLLLPIRIRLKDGGTTTYHAILYRVVVWHAFDGSEPGGYKTGTEIHVFPKNFTELGNSKS